MERDLSWVIDALPEMVWTALADGRVDFLNQQWCKYTGQNPDEGRGQGWQAAIHPAELPAVLAAWEDAVDKGQPYRVENRIRRADGVYQWFLAAGSPVLDDGGKLTGWCVLQSNIDHPKRVEALLAGEKRALEMIATGESLYATLTTLCLLMEELCPACSCCSTLLLDPETNRLWHAASPNVPSAYTTAIDGFDLGPNASSCGTAAYYGQQVMASDISVDPRWTEFRDIALENGLRACWSTPIFSQQGGVLGTFALFSAQPGLPTAEDQEVIAQLTHLASVAIERERAQMSLMRALDDLRGSSGRLAATIDAIPGFVWSATPDGSVDFLNQQWCDYTGISLEGGCGWDWQATIHPDDAAQLPAQWRTVLESGQSGEFEVRLRRFDGTFRWFLIRAVPLRDEAGDIVKWYGLNTDIEDRRQAEAVLAGEKRLLEMVAGGHALSEVLEALCLLVEDTASGCYGSVFLVDPAGTRLEHGAAPSLPRSFVDSIAGRPVCVDAGPSAMAACLNEQVISTDFQSETRWKASEWCPMAQAHGLRACWSTPISSTSGKVLGSFAIYYDEPRSPLPIHQRLIEQFTQIASIAIERAQSDTVLKRSEARKSAILDSALDCIVTIDHDSRIVEFNPAAERTFGHRREEVVGERLADVIIPPPLREKHERGFARYLSTGEQRVLGRRVEMTAMRADGREFPVELAITRIPSDGPPSFTGYLRDITERRKAEEELRRSEAFLAQGQQLSRTGTFSWRVATGEITWSDQLYRMFEFDKGIPVTLELIGTRVHPEDVPLMSEMIDRAQAAVSDFQYEHRLLMPDDSIKHLHLVAQGTRDSDGRLEYIGAVQDVTERRSWEEALSKARAELTHVARVTSLGTLTASIAHEVNQPLSGIITNASTCLRMLAAEPPNVEGALETARRTIRDANRASDVITRLRALFSKKEAATELVDLNEAAREVIALSVNKLRRDRVILQPEWADGLPHVLGDRVQLQQVILNLLMNASDAMNGIDDRARRLIIRTERDGRQCARLTVQDVGVGFEPHAAEKLFEAFYTTKGDGMGIGLSVSRSIIERHLGRIWAAPNEGPGATFAFSLPIAEESGRTELTKRG